MLLADLYRRRLCHRLCLSRHRLGLHLLVRLLRGFGVLRQWYLPGLDLCGRGPELHGFGQLDLLHRPELPRRDIGGVRRHRPVLVCGSTELALVLLSETCGNDRRNAASREVAMVIEVFKL